MKYTGPSSFVIRQWKLNIRAKDGRRVTAAEMKYLRKTGYSWRDFETNTENAKERNTTPVLDKTQEYRKKLFPTYTQNVS